MDYLALLQLILQGLAQAPEAIAIAENAWNQVKADFSTEDQATIDKMFMDAKTTDAADTAQAVADLDKAAEE